MLQPYSFSICVRPGFPGFEAFLALWPTWLSYAVRDLFIAIVWVNHRYPVRYAADATPRLLCFNFVRSGAIVALKYPLAGPGICIACLALYLRPDPPEATTKKASREKPSRDA